MIKYLIILFALLSSGAQAQQVPNPAPMSIAGNCTNITAFGGKGDGVTNNGPALTAALAASPADAKCVAFPAGKFKFTSVFTYAYPTTSMMSVRLVGAGIDTTQLIGQSGASLLGITLNHQMQSFHISDLSLIAVNPCSTCTALSLTQAGTLASGVGYSGASDISRISITGSDRSGAFPSGANYWLTGIDINGLSNVNFDGVYIEGIQNSSGPTPGVSRGIYLHGDAAHIPVQYNFTGVTVNLYERGLDYGAYVQGVSIVASNFTGDRVGVFVSAPAGQGLSQLAITGSQLNSCSNIWVPSVTPGTVTLSYLMISNNVFLNGPMPYSCGTYNTSILTSNASAFALISNNVFAGQLTHTGVDIWGPSYVSGQVSGNMFNNFAIAIDSTSNPVTTSIGTLIANNIITNSTTGIRLGPYTRDAVVQNNLMQGNGTDLANNTGNTYWVFTDIPQDCSALLNLYFNGSPTGITYTNKFCQTSTVNRQTFIDFDFTLSNKGATAGAAQIQLPNPAVNTQPGGSVTIGNIQNMTGLTGAIIGTIDSAASVIDLRQMGATGAAFLLNTSFTNTSRLQGRAEFRAYPRDLP